MVIQAGERAPDFTLIDQHGEEITLSEMLEEQPVALVFFPLAFSGICTGELCELRDNLELFEHSRVRLIGISVDSKFALQAWSQAEGYTFSIASDFWPHGEVSQRYGVFDETLGFASRATVLIGQDGLIVESFENPRSEPRDLDTYRRALSRL